MNIKTIFLLFVLLAMIAPVNAHGLHVTPDNATTIVIADNATGVMTKRLADDMGLDVKVYKFQSETDVLHELEHAVNDSDKRILVVAYQDTGNEFLSKYPATSNRIFVSSSDEMDIKNGLKLLNSTSNVNAGGGFLTPLAAGLVLGIIVGLGVGVFLMKRKIS